MADLNGIARRLEAADLGLSEVRVHLPREVRLRVRRERIPDLADALRRDFDARPELILAEDVREQDGEFILRYLFEIPMADAIVVASAGIPLIDPSFPSLATRWYLASRFEREIHDLFGLRPDGHPDLRRLPLHQFWPESYRPLLKNSAPPGEFADDGTPFPFLRVEGEGIFEITVGPVHAGIIEPGHFRFSVEGETIVRLSSRLYFVHKGIEKLFETLPLGRGVDLAERVSGDSSVAHGLAFCQAVEGVAASRIPPRAARLRVVLLELERLYNHIGDFGAICTDTGFAVAHAHCLRVREEVLRLNARLFGHRLLRGVLVPGGVSRDLSAGQVAELRECLTRLLADFDEMVAIALSNGMLLDRLQGTGLLTVRTAREMQVVGVAARASGVDADARRDHPFAAYGDLEVRVPVFSEGDVWARTMVRIQEARESARLIALALDTLEDGPIVQPIEALPCGEGAFGLVEGWRGPIWHWVVAGPGNSLRRVKVKDPSFANWPALSHAILNNIVPDFPLVNKSFNLSYAGHDL